MNFAELLNSLRERLDGWKNRFSGMTGRFDTYLLRTRLRRWIRRIAGALDFTQWPRELHYYVEIPADPHWLREILKDDPLVYPFRFPLAKIMAVLESKSGDTRLHFAVTARSLLPEGLAIRLFRRGIQNRLEELANHLFFRCLSAPLVAPDFDPALIQSTDFPSLDRRNFRQPGAALRERKNRLLSWLDAPVRYPARNYFFHYQVQPGYPQSVELTEVLLISMPLPLADLHSLLPPPFHPGSFAPPELLLIAARETGLHKATGSSHRPAIRWEVRAPVEFITRSNHLHGWLPLEACRVPLDRPTMPFDPVTGSLGRTAEGLRFCAGQRRRSLLYHCVYRPQRKMRLGDGLPYLLNGPNQVFLQNPDDLNITVLTEIPDFAVNQVELAVNETATFEHHHRQAPLPTPADYYGDRWELTLEIPGQARYLRKLRLEISYDFATKLRDTHYRPYPARVGEPVG